MASLSIGRLPVRLVPLVGRLAEIQAVVDALSRGRLLTLTGPGGTGKTRLALAVAGLAGVSFPSGVCWVDLAPLGDPTVIAQEVAHRLGLPDSPATDAADVVAGYVADRRVLIVLDNCEHLTVAVAAVAERLLQLCPALSILATSREVLGVDGEYSWPVPPLSLPPGGAQPAAAELAQFDAVKLFEQRAQLVRPSFRLADHNAADVLAVCRQLDGLPLAIELAAARMRILSAGQLAERLDDVFGVLTGGARSAPRRHQALRATLDWSHDLLDTDECAVFRRLAVFAGGFTLPAAEQVSASSAVPSRQVLELLTQLADKSLLRVDHAAGDVRYYLLATVRAYARERLEQAAGELGPARQAHLQWMAGLVEQAGSRIEQNTEPGDLDRELDRLDAETPDLRAALEFARESGDTIAALRIAAPLGRYAYLRGHYHEVREWMDNAVTAAPGAPVALRAKALLGSGRLALLQCDYVPAVRRLDAALRLYRELADGAGMARALQFLGSVAREQGRYARSIEVTTESLAVAAAAGDRWAVASAHSYLGFVSWLQLDFGRAVSECTTALGMFRELGDAEGIAWSLLSLGAVARYQGARERAAALLAESRTLAESIGFREGIAWSLEQLGLLTASEDPGGAAAMLRRSLEIHHDLQDRWRTCSVLADLAALAVSQGHATQCTRLLAASQKLRAAIGTVIAPCESAQQASTEAAARAALGDEGFATAWQLGELTPISDLQVELAEPDGRGPGGPEPGRRVRAVAGTMAMPAQRSMATAGAADASSADRAASGSTGSRLRIRALGAATVHRGDVMVTAADWGYSKPRELLFLLVSSPPLTKEQIGAALWPDQVGQRLGNALHTALRGLRRGLGDPGWVQYANGRYTFNATWEHHCDVTAFEQALTEARQARPAAAALPHLQRAIAAYGGDFLDSMPTGEWAQARRDELHRALEAALLAAGRLYIAAGRYQPAAVAFRRVIAHEPLNETAHRELMNCWMHLGETARAVRHYEDLVELLSDQVGVAPAAETTALYRRLVAGT
jgi:predicted ATPase/DNA-binding SARP family transcriptional activator